MSRPTSIDTLQRILEPLGLWNADGVSRRARARLCPECGVVTMRGLDADRCALAVTCDPTSLNRLGEVSALFAGIRTYSLTWEAGRYVIDHREPERIAAAPAGSKANSDVLAEHHCGRNAPADMQAPTNLARPALAPPTKGASNVIPF